MKHLFVVWLNLVSGSKAASELVLIYCDFYLQELLLDASDERLF